jgi:hypothetical protein
MGAGRLFALCRTRRGESRLLLSPAAVLGTAVLVAGLGCSRTVDVEMQEGKTTMAPVSISFVRYIKFRVANTGTNRHHFIVVETNLGAGKLPVDGGRVRKCSYSGEPPDLATVWTRKMLAI